MSGAAHHLTDFNPPANRPGGTTSPVTRALADFGLRTFGRLRSRHYDPRQTRVIACAGRSGSTWLADIVCADGRRPLIWEPLHPGSHPRSVQRAGMRWQHYLKPGDDAPRVRAFVGDIINGRELNADVVTRQQLKLSQFARFDSYVVKFTCANLLLHWLLAEFPLRAALMVRHPCAVIASQLAHGGWHHVGVNNMTVPWRVIEAYPHLREVLNLVRTRVEVLAFEWALQVFVPLCAPKPYPFHLICYEDLVMNGDHCVETLYSHFDLTDVHAGKRALARLSGTSQRAAVKADDFLLSWQNRLLPVDIEQIFSVIRAVGIDFYGREPMVNRQRLDAFSDKAMRYAAKR